MLLPYLIVNQVPAGDTSLRGTAAGAESTAAMLQSKSALHACGSVLAHARLPHNLMPYLCSIVSTTLEGDDFSPSHADLTNGAAAIRVTEASAVKARKLFDRCRCVVISKRVIKAQKQVLRFRVLYTL
jgi:hypothetical protein